MRTRPHTQPSTSAAPTSGAPAISVTGSRKSYGDREVVRGVSFDIAAGKCFGLLGHNGAGKTTTIEILEGYLSRDAGEVSVLGADPADPGAGWRSRIGIVLPLLFLEEPTTGLGPAARRDSWTMIEGLRITSVRSDHGRNHR